MICLDSLSISVPFTMISKFLLSLAMIFSCSVCFILPSCPLEETGAFSAHSVYVCIEIPHLYCSSCQQYSPLQFIQSFPAVCPTALLAVAPGWFSHVGFSAARGELHDILPVFTCIQGSLCHKESKCLFSHSPLLGCRRSESFVWRVIQ